MIRYPCILSLSFLWLVVMNVLYLTEASNCSVYDENGSMKTCNKKCCGIWRHAICTESCVGFSCDRNSDCDDGCCQEGQCKTSDCLPMRLIIAVVTTATAMFVLLFVVMFLWNRLRKKRKLIARNIPRPRGHYVDMDEPYWRVKSFDPRVRLSRGDVATNCKENNGFNHSN